METYKTSYAHLADELGLSLAEATGFIKSMEKCGMAKKVGHAPLPEGVVKKGKRAAVFEVNKNVEIFVTDIPFNPLQEKKTPKAEKAEKAETTEGEKVEMNAEVETSAESVEDTEGEGVETEVTDEI